MKEDDEDINENLIDDRNTNNKQQKLTIGKKSTNKLESELEIDQNNNTNSILHNNENIKDNNPKASIGVDIIEDNIKKSDTFSNRKKKKLEKNNDFEIIYEGDEDLNSENGNKISKTKNNNNGRFNNIIDENILKYAYLITIIIYIITTIISFIIFHIRKEKENKPFLFCFAFLDRMPGQSQDKTFKSLIYFLTDLTSFYIIQIILLFTLISVCYMLIKGPSSEIKDFFKDMSFYFLCPLILNIPIYISGMFIEEFYGKKLIPIIYLILIFLGLLCMIKIFIVAKRHKYKNISSLINISVLTSFMTSYQCYCFLFCLSYCYMNFYQSGDEHPEAEVVAACTYFIIGVIIMTVFKDIFFVIAMVIIENGLLYAKRKISHLLLIALFNISIISLNFASIIIIIFAYNKKLFRLKEKQ